MEQSKSKPFSFETNTPQNSQALPSGQSQTTVADTNFVASAQPQVKDRAKPAVNLTPVIRTTNSSAQSSEINFGQIEENINKWALELEEQEKIFTNQATQINAWDKLLIANNDKIVELNEAVQKVQADQQTLEQELEFITTQHAELEESIGPLQNDFLNMPQIDIDRTQTYFLVENLDTQLKQMSEDLKEIIDSLNESNKVQEYNDPIIQVGKILNAHMNSLQWIESCSSIISTKLDNVIKMHETLQRDSERSFRLTYYD